MVCIYIYRDKIAIFSSIGFPSAGYYTDIATGMTTGGHIR
jgi:hypothetical protein